MRLTRHLKGSLSLRLGLTLTSPHAATRWLILQKARRHSARLLRLLVGARFQALFHSPLGVLFTFPSRYLFTIGRRGVLRLGGWSPHVQTGFHVSRPTRVCRYLTPTGLSPAMVDLSRSFDFISRQHWPGPGSLATTTGVSVDVLSSGY